MARRLEVELTSSREDGTWTWRAAGAKQPKGEVSESRLYDGAQVGDICRIEAEFHLDGIEVLETFAPKKKKERSDLLEMIVVPLKDDELVTQVKAKGPRDRGGDRPERSRERSERKPRSDRSPSPQKREDRGARPDRQAREPERPRPKRLRPKNTHRAAVMAEVPDAQRPIADQVLAGGIPAVRAAIEKQNKAAGEGEAKIPVGPVLKIAEDLMPKLRTAEWRDRAEAALAEMDELDLRDLRSVVVAADVGARDEETRAMAATLKEGLAIRIEADHTTWMADLTKAVADGRTVRALRLSSRPVKAGSPLPAEMAKTLAEQASAALATDVPADRWATVLDAVAFSPLRNAITPSGYPTETNDEFLDAVRSVADRVPLIAGHYGIDPKEAPAAKKRRHAASKTRMKESAGARSRRGRGDRSDSESSTRSPKSDRQPRSDRTERSDRGPRGNRKDKPRGPRKRKSEPLEPGKAAQEARRLAAEAEAAKNAPAPESETPAEEALISAEPTNTGEESTAATEEKGSVTEETTGTSEEASRVTEEAASPGEDTSDEPVASQEGD